MYFYTTYLRLRPDAPNRADVEDLIKEMNANLEAQKSIQNKPPEGVVGPDGQQQNTGNTNTGNTGSTGTGTGNTGPEVGVVEGPLVAPATTIAARMTAGVAFLKSGDLDIPIQPSIGIVGGYPLKAGPATIELAINVEGAMVTVDDNPVQVVGKTARAKVDAEGEHKVIVTANGRNPFESTVTTKSGETQKLEAKLEKPKSGTKPATVATKPATTTTPQTKPATTTSTPQPGTGSAAKPGFVDKNAPIDPF